MNDKKRLNSYEDLPLVLDVADIQRIMGISRASAYELVHTPGFPAFRRGRLIKVSKIAFLSLIHILKFKTLSVKRLFGRVAIGRVLSMSGITIALFLVTKPIAVLLTGGTLPVSYTHL